MKTLDNLICELDAKKEAEKRAWQEGRIASLRTRLQQVLSNEVIDAIGQMSVDLDQARLNWMHHGVSFYFRMPLIDRWTTQVAFGKVGEAHAWNVDGDREFLMTLRTLVD